MADARFPEELFRSTPKAELHVHLEGSVGAETLLVLAAEHAVEPPASDPEGIRRWYSFADFDDFLERYFFVCRLLRRRRDFQRIAFDYLLISSGIGIHSFCHTYRIDKEWEI